MMKQIGINEKLYVINVKENLNQNPYKIWVIICNVYFFIYKYVLSIKGQIYTNTLRRKLMHRDTIDSLDS